MEMGNKNLHVIIVKFTSEESIGSHTEKKESYESSLIVNQLYKKYYELIVQWEK